MRGSVIAFVVLALVGCRMADNHALQAKAASDLSCPASQLRKRGVLGSNGLQLVDGCNRYAEYEPTSEGWRIRTIGEGPPPASTPVTAGNGFR